MPLRPVGLREGLSWKYTAPGRTVEITFQENAPTMMQNRYTVLSPVLVFHPAQAHGEFPHRSQELPHRSQELPCPQVVSSTVAADRQIRCCRGPRREGAVAGKVPGVAKRDAVFRLSLAMCRMDIL